MDMDHPSPATRMLAMGVSEPQADCRSSGDAPASLLPSLCDHQGVHVKVVTVRDFCAHATEMFRSDDVIPVTRDGRPAGFFLPWDTPELSVEVRREVFVSLSEQVGEHLARKGVGESELVSLTAVVTPDAYILQSRLWV
jgi:hypothetical protein